MSAPIKRSASNDLVHPEQKKPRVLTEIEKRIDEFRKLIGVKGSESPELGEALFTWIASNSADDEMWNRMFAALGLPTETLEFHTGDPIQLPRCIWDVHGSYFQALFSKKMRICPLNEDSALLETFKMCLKACSSDFLLNQTNWQDLLLLAHKYQVLWLKNECEDFLCKNKNLFQFSEADQQLLLCFAAHYQLSKLLRTCLHQFIRYDVKVTTDPQLLNEIQEVARQHGLADLKLYASSTLNDSLWIDSSTGELCLELDSEDVETHLQEIKGCLSSQSPWHSPQIRLSINRENAVQTETLQFLLEENTTLTGLSLLIDLEKIGTILETMRENRAIKYLALYHEETIDSGDFDTPLAQFLNFLKEHASLNTLCLWGCKLGPQSAAALQTFLAFNPHLESLTIGNNDLEKEMLIGLQKGCLSNAKLTKLSIEECDICGEGSLVDFLASLESHPTLRNLNLGQPFNRDGLNEHPLVDLLELLKKNKILETLTLERIEDQDLSDFIENFVHEECVLKEIIFKDNYFEGRASIFNIYEAMKIKPIKIIFHNTEMDPDAHKQLLIEQRYNPRADYIDFSGTMEIQKSIEL